MVSEYAGDTYVQGYEVTSGVVTNEMLHTDPRFNQDARLLIYATDRGGHTERFDLSNNQLDTQYYRNGPVVQNVGTFDPSSLNLRLGGNLIDQGEVLFPLEDAPFMLTEDRRDLKLEAKYTRGPEIRSILIRTSTPLSPQQVEQHREAGTVNNTARDFGYPQAMRSPVTPPSGIR